MLISGAFRVFIIDIFAGNVYDIFDYCSLVVSREVFWHENAKIPRHTARIYEIRINSVHREACY